MLRHIPTHVTTDGLQPAEMDGVRAYQSAGVRFRLAEDRVQELLMGEQLYGDPALAIRELYQNALDACRYREARTEYLRRTRDFDRRLGRPDPVQPGRRRGGRPYLDCVDNGIGMGVRELSEVFAQAGVRLGDLPEFLEEQAEWARLDPPVQLFPNSRFGIGVLSYFMLAEEITVDTCRMGRDGAARAAAAGLHRRSGQPVPDPHPRSGRGVAAPRSGCTCAPAAPACPCVDTLRNRAVGGRLRHRGRPRHRPARSGSRASSPTPTPPKQAASKSTQAAPAPRSWPTPRPACGGAPATARSWPTGCGPGRTSPGAVVNLSRELAPRLSVDRTKILAYREEDLERLLWQAVDALTAAGPAVLTYDWLYTFAHARPLIADVIFDRALAAGYRQWTLGGDPVDAAIAGCFLPDGGSPSGPDQLVEWRLTALAAAGRYAKLITAGEGWAQVVRARPSDALILSVDIDGSAPWLDPVEIVPLAHLVRAARRIGRSPSEIAARLEELAYTTAVGHETVGADPDDALFMSRDLDSSRPWLDPANPVLLPHILKAAQRSGRPVREVAARLTRLGFTFATSTSTLLPIDQFDAADLVLASRDLDGSFPWLDPAEPVKLLHLIRVAHRVAREVSDIAARLAALGYGLPPGCEGLQTSPEDLVLLSRDLDSAAPWLDPAEAVTPDAPAALRQADRAVHGASSSHRLALLGFTIGVDPASIADVEITPEDIAIASRDLEGSPPWLDATKPVTHLAPAARGRGEEPCRWRRSPAGCASSATGWPSNPTRSSWTTSIRTTPSSPASTSTAPTRGWTRPSRCRRCTCCGRPGSPDATCTTSPPG